MLWHTDMLPNQIRCHLLAMFLKNILKIPTTKYSCAILANATFCKNHLQLNGHSHQTKIPKPEKNLKSDESLFIVNNNIKDELSG